jgi:hypothetical protein
MSVIKSSAGRLVLGLAVVLAMSLASAAKAADTGTVEGKVLGKDGAGVSGAKVRLMKASDVGGKKEKAPPAAAPAGEKPKPVAEADSATDGAFSMKDVPAGDYVVMAMVKGQGGAREKVTVKAGETSTVTLTLKERKGGKKAPAAAK